MKILSVHVLGPSIITTALLSLFGIQMVTAQIAATSSESTAISTDVIADASTASTTPTADAATAIVPAATPEVATSTELTQQSPPTPPLPPEPTPSPQNAMALEISNLEDQYMQKTGKYLQIIAGNQLPTYESGSVAGKLGKNIPDDVNVDVYEAVSGKGYQIYFEEGDIVYSYGYGPEATERTYRLQIPVPSSAATSSSMF